MSPVAVPERLRVGVALDLGGFRGLGFRVQGLGFRGFRVSGLGVHLLHFRVSGCWGPLLLGLGKYIVFEVHEFRQFEVEG